MADEERKTIELYDSPEEEANALIVDEAVTIRDTLPIEKGGTNGTTAEEARTNLGVYSKEEVDKQIDDVELGESGLKENLEKEIKDVSDSIPTKTSELENNGNGTGEDDDYFITKAEADEHYTSGLTYKGHVESKNDLPEDASDGDFYYVVDEGVFYLYDGDHWDSTGSLVDLSDYVTKEELNSVKSDLEALIPTKVSELENDSGYINNSALSDYAKTSEVNSAISEAVSPLETEISGKASSSDLTSLNETLTAEIQTKADNSTVSNLSDRVEKIELNGLYYRVIDD